MVFASCKKTTTDFDGTYYRYTKGEISDEETIVLNNGKWTNSEMSGSFSIVDDKIFFYVEADKEQMLMMSGKIADGQITIGDLFGSNNEVIYCLETNVPEYIPCSHINENGDFECDLCGEFVQMYTITLDTKEGSFEDGNTKLTLVGVSGSSVPTIATPTLDGYVFLGWYSTDDNKLTDDVLWNSANAKFNANLNCYAKWKLDFKEYEITYMHGYKGAKNKVEQTVEGLATYVPERKGYIFNGWHYAVLEDENYVEGDKFDPTIIVNSDLTLIASWINLEDVISRLSSPSITCKDGVFSWEPIDGVDYYAIEFYDSIGEKINSTTIDSDSTLAYTIPQDYEKGTYKLKVKAIGNGETTATSDWSSCSYIHKELPEVAVQFDINSNILSWATSAKDVVFDIYINGILIDNDVTYTQCDMNQYNAGSYTVRVTSQRENYYSSTGLTSFEKLRLKTPEVETRLRAEDYMVIIWLDGDVKADSFEYRYADGEWYYTDENSIEISADSSLWQDGKIEFSVRSKCDDAQYINSYVAKTTIVKTHGLTIDNENTSAGTVSAEITSAQYPVYTVTYSLNLGREDDLTYITPSKVYHKKQYYEYGDTWGSLRYEGVAFQDGEYIYVLKGWYETPNPDIDAEPYDFTKTLTADIILYAQWAKVYSETKANFIGWDDPSSGGINVAPSGTYSDVYFIASETGTFTMKYDVSFLNQNYSNCLDLEFYNVTRGRTIKSRSTVYTTGYGANDHELSFSATKGDVIRLRGYPVNSRYYLDFTYSTNMSCTEYNDGALADSTYLVPTEIQTDGSVTNAYVGTEVTLTATPTDTSYVFDGWYDGDILVSSESTYTFIMPDYEIKYTAKWKSAE